LTAPGFVTPSTFVVRHDTNDFLTKYFDAEGPAMCIGYTYDECRAKAYNPYGLPVD
jgi:hypothetical protein